VENGRTVRGSLRYIGPGEKMDGRAGRKRVRRVVGEGTEVESENRRISVNY
jgi:hypothetical protein